MICQFIGSSSKTEAQTIEEKENFKKEEEKKILLDYQRRSPAVV
jgi:hypothetical protein